MHLRCNSASLCAQPLSVPQAPTLHERRSHTIFDCRAFGFSRPWVKRYCALVPRQSADRQQVELQLLLLDEKSLTLVEGMTLKECKKCFYGANTSPHIHLVCLSTASLCIFYHVQSLLHSCHVSACNELVAYLSCLTMQEAYCIAFVFVA